MELNIIKPVFTAVLLVSSILFAGNALADTVVVEDVNADGMPDIVTTGNGGNPLSVYLGKGDGTFEKSFSADGADKVVIRDQQGKQIQLVAVDYSLETIRSKSVSANTTTGDCFYLLQFAGKTFKITLPPSACQE